MKSATDQHWDGRARQVGDPDAVNIEDVYQRELELEFVCDQLAGAESLLEVGCGNGFNTTKYRERVAQIDAFDFSADMIRRAEVDHPDPSVHYYEGSVLDPAAAPAGAHDVVVCIRTLINLSDLAAQRTALGNLVSWVRPGGRLVLIEGFSDGFEALTELRESLGLPPLNAAPINVYAALDDLRDLLDAAGEVEAQFHTGTWDVLTRVVLPLTAGLEHAQGVGAFHPALLEVARILGPQRTERFARELGWAIRRPESA